MGTDVQISNTEVKTREECTSKSVSFQTVCSTTGYHETCTPTTTSPTTPICEQLPSSAQSRCKECIGDPKKPAGFWTAIGCLKTAPNEAVRQIFGLALGLGGIFILIQILLGAFGLITSSGNPSAIQKAKSRIIDSVIALLFVVFSVTIVQLIGISIFNLPGMGN
jgi:hypothetical protein